MYMRTIKKKPDAPTVSCSIYDSPFSFYPFIFLKHVSVEDSQWQILNTEINKDIVWYWKTGKMESVPKTQQDNIEQDTA